MKLNFKEKYLIILVAICFIAVGFYYSYAIFITKQLQENVVVVKTINKDITLSVNGEDNKFTIKANEEHNITLSFKNNGNNKYYYLVLVKGIKTGVKVTSDDIVKWDINPKEEKNLLVHVNNETKEDVTLEFKIQIDIDDDFDKEIGYSYINSVSNYDHSKANKPEIDSLKMIPVNYRKLSDTEGYWYKTDINNQKDVWYDYDNGIWANAVLMNEEAYRRYQYKEIGTEIAINDVLGFYVWIPRFKYYIINSTNYTNYERISNIVFEKGINSTGTITCNDKISFSNDKHIYSEVCNDNKYNHIYDNLSTYTHPSFGNKNGFWVAKFLTSEGGKVLPNVYMIERNISEANNISKKINNSHILTNMEYGALVLLQNSSYGKAGNPLYNDLVFNRVYANTNAYGITGCSSEYNNRTNTFLISKTDKCLEYNNLADLSHYSNGVHYPIGYGGGGASSTGNVYGVYDLANLHGELVSAYVIDLDGNIPKITNYYDVYSYIDYLGKVSNSSNVHNLYRYKYGDGIKEHFRSFSENGMWQNGSITQNANTGIFVRGDVSIYTTRIEDISYVAPFRLVIN